MPTDQETLLTKLEQSPGFNRVTRRTEAAKQLAASGKVEIKTVDGELYARSANQ
ncbi:hypothetical protein [Agrobacterium vitis]|uniref:hypothetical protein n=1 Tax=Agrobacterium vitis TaxID=373 RepID=UPI001F3B2F7C|nr:hypothetical protein [Agrobacterium vitis]